MAGAAVLEPISAEFYRQQTDRISSDEDLLLALLAEHEIPVHPAEVVKSHRNEARDRLTAIVRAEAKKEVFFRRLAARVALASIIVLWLAGLIAGTITGVSTITLMIAISFGVIATVTAVLISLMVLDAVNTWIRACHATWSRQTLTPIHQIPEWVRQKVETLRAAHSDVGFAIYELAKVKPGKPRLIEDPLLFVRLRGAEVCIAIWD